MPVKSLFQVFFSLLLISNTLYAKSLKEVEYITSLSDGRLLIVKNDEWKNIDEGVDFKNVILKRDESGFTVALKLLRFNSMMVGIKVIFTKNPEKSLDVKNTAERDGAIAAINGSFFDINWKPLGLLISNGKTINNKIATHPIYSGIFYIKDGIPHIVYRNDFSLNGVTQAIQVGPILLFDGKDAEGLKDIHSINYRSGIATDDLNRVIIYATDTNHDGISWHELRQIMKMSDINCLNVLNLDGGGSTQMFVSTQLFSDYIAGKVNVPVVISFYRK